MAACTEWYTRTTRCRNGITEKTKYPVRYADGRPGRSARRKAARKAGRAGDNAERIFARLLNNNFTEGRSVHLAMTYSPAGYRRLEARAAAIMQQLPGIPERDAIFRAAQKEFENFVRRVQYELKGFVYIASTSDMDGKAWSLSGYIIMWSLSGRLWRSAAASGPDAALYMSGSCIPPTAILRPWQAI